MTIGPSTPVFPTTGPLTIGVPTTGPSTININKIFLSSALAFIDGSADRLRSDLNEPPKAKKSKEIMLMQYEEQFHDIILLLELYLRLLEKDHKDFSEAVKALFQADQGIAGGILNGLDLSALVYPRTGGSVGGPVM